MSSGSNSTKANMFQKLLDSTKKKTFLSRLLPFAVFVVGGSFFLKSFARIRYDFRKGKKLSQEEAEAMGLEIKDIDVTRKDMLKEMQKDDYDDWQNVRGPRPWEDSKTVQVIERQKLEAKNK